MTLTVETASGFYSFYNCLPLSPTPSTLVTRVLVTFGEVTGKSLVSCFFSDTQCSNDELTESIKGIKMSKMCKPKRHG